MKLKVFNKSVIPDSRFIALFSSRSRPRRLEFADGFNSRNSIGSVNTEEDFPSGLKGYFEYLGYNFSEESDASVHKTLNTVCDPRFFTQGHMPKVFIIELLDENDANFRVVEEINDLEAWFKQYPYPVANR